MSPHDAPQGWTTSDALLLLSVGRRRGVSIDSLLSTTDARDASVPSETESAVGLGTLMASGLVEIVEGGIVDATAQDDELVLTFEHGETLQVWRPGGLTVSERELVIKDADRVRWEWGDPTGLPVTAHACPSSTSATARRSRSPRNSWAATTAGAPNRPAGRPSRSSASERPAQLPTAPTPPSAADGCHRLSRTWASLFC